MSGETIAFAPLKARRSQQARHLEGLDHSPPLLGNWLDYAVSDFDGHARDLDAVFASLETWHLQTENAVMREHSAHDLAVGLSSAETSLVHRHVPRVPLYGDSSRESSRAPDVEASHRCHLAVETCACVEAVMHFHEVKALMISSAPPHLRGILLGTFLRTCFIAWK